MSSKNELQDILRSLSGIGSASDENDGDLSGNSRREIEKSRDEVISRDEAYSHLLNDYIEAHKTKEKYNKNYKLVFFVVTICIFVGIIVASLILIFRVSSKSYLGYSGIAVVVGCISSIISSIIVLPKIIAQHLFPVDEDKHILGIVQNMQQHDERLRNIENTSEK